MNLDAQLVQLEKIAIVRRVEETDPTYFFHHALTQESIYRALLKPTRRDLHLAVARAFEQVYGDELDEYAVLLAEHYAQAGDDAKTYEYSARAGTVALRVYAHVEAVAQFSRAVEILKNKPNLAPPARLCELYLQLGRVLEISGRFDRALQTYEEMETIALQRDDRAMQLAALVALATIHSTPTSIADAEHARTLTNLALALAREIGDRQTEARALWNLMLLGIFVGEFEHAADYGEQSLAIARELGMQDHAAITLNDLFRPYISLNQFERARAVSEQAREYFRATDNKPMLTDNLIRSTILDAVFGEFDRVIALCEEARKISESIGNLWGQSFSQMFVGSVYFVRGEIARALETMQESIRLGHASGFMMPLIFTSTDLGLVYGQLGMIDRGIELVRQAQVIAVERFPRSEGRASSALARLYLLQGDLAQAQTQLQKSLANTTVDFAQRAFDQLPLAEIEMASKQGDLEHAIQLAEREYDRMCQMGARVFRADVLYLQGQALLAQGHADAARQVFRQAKREAEPIGARWILWQIYAALDERAPARRTVEFIVQNSPQDSRSSFLNLPAVRAVLA